MTVHTFFTSAAGGKHHRADVLEFHRDLEKAVKAELGDSATGTLGMFARGFWDPSLREDCRTTKVLVALISPDYVGSEWCRREWAIFMDRVMKATPPGGEGPWCVMNVRWSGKVTAHAGPLRSIQWPQWHLTTDHALVEKYLQKGLLYLKRTDKPSYKRLCHDLASLVAEAAELDLPRLAPGEEEGAEERVGLAEPQPKPSPKPAPRTRTPRSSPKPARSAAPRKASVDPGAKVDPVVRLLAQVTALEERSVWEAFVKRIGDRKGGYRRLRATGPLPERCHELVAMLVRPYGPRLAYELVLTELESVEGARPTADAIATLIEELPDIAI